MVPQESRRNSKAQLEDEPTTMVQLWIFGYGSLVWNPGFNYTKAFTGYIRGYKRRFWQGNVTHRGTQNKPGRVATLIEDPEGEVWGKAFLVEGEEALPYLDTRECRLGGYTTKRVEFHPSDGEGIIQVLLYLATPSNEQWLGEAPEIEIATQILTSSGPSGHNVEYLIRLAEFMRESAPGIRDDHLFVLEQFVRAGLQQIGHTTTRYLKGSRTNHSPRIRYPSPIPVVKKMRCPSV